MQFSEHLVEQAVKLAVFFDLGQARLVFAPRRIPIHSAEGRIEMLLLHRAPDDVERLPASVRRVGREVLRNLSRFLRESLNAERKAHYERQNRLFHKAFSYRECFVVIEYRGASKIAPFIYANGSKHEDRRENQADRQTEPGNLPM